MTKLAGKTALITGGTTGIGLAAARLFAAEGARVAITGQDEGRLAVAQRDLGNEVLAIRADAASADDRAALARRLEAEYGGLDVVFLNAGIAKFAGLADATEALFDEIFAVNVKGVLFTVQALAPLLRPGASIVVNTSVNNRMGMPGTLVYGPSKAAARALVRVLAGELAPRGVRVNAVSPGPVETPIYGKLGLTEEQLAGVAAGLSAKIPLGRFGQAEEIARAALFLASADSSYVVGAELMADGGWTEVAA